MKYEYFLILLLLTGCTRPVAPVTQPVSTRPTPILLPTTASLPALPPTAEPLPTATVISDPFCADQTLPVVLMEFASALEARNGELLAKLVSAEHGLDVYYWRHGRMVNYDREHAEWLFHSTYQVNWGPEPGSGLDTIGSFQEIILPALLEVFDGPYELLCKEPGLAASYASRPWPEEYASVGYYTVYLPGTEEYGGLDWQAWLVGIDFVEGQPGLYALVHFEWEP
ncbi:MAG: hypothetical protein JXA13_01250 [Anaerolineales bacterium]|nr:hypothetical protein [Anaerolineales bacterium]